VVRGYLLQWTVLDGMATPIRATSRAYRANGVDYERAHLQEAISYLRQAPVASGATGLTENEVNIVIARLELRKRLLGGFVSDRRAENLGEREGFEQERIRSRNWELLRQSAERTGLVFEPIGLAGQDSEYGMLWLPSGAAAPAGGTDLGAVWKILNIRDPWTDPRVTSSKGWLFTRSGDPRPLMPLAVYSLSYSKQPLLLIDFRDKLHLRRHEMVQRAINELTAGVIGISHFTNWYYYVAADLYDFVAGRRGRALDAEARLDSYSEFRTALALDHNLDPELRAEMRRRAESLAVNPLDASPERELETAMVRYDGLQDGADAADMLARLDTTRRFELATYTESRGARFSQAALHGITFGLYTHRAKEAANDVEMLDRYRRADAALQFLDSLTRDGTAPEVACDSSRIHASVAKLAALIPEVHSDEIRAHAKAALLRVRELSRDSGVQTECLVALSSFVPKREGQATETSASGGAVSGTAGILEGSAIHEQAHR